MEDNRFSRGDFDTGFVDALRSAEIIPSETELSHFIIAAFLLSKNQFSTGKENSMASTGKKPEWLTGQKKGRFIDGL